MANGMYNIGKQGLIDGTIDMDTNVIKARLVKDTYTFSNTDTSLTPITKITGTTDQTLGSRTVTDGVFDAADPTFTAVAGGETITAWVVFKFVTNDADSIPIGFLDLTDTPTNGSDIIINIDSGANKVFALNG